ncbi:glycosyltransferase family 4 protein [Campylobacterota bacterium DY0563]
MKKIKVINQFTPNVAFGDSISNALLYMQRLLYKMGFETKIYISADKVDINFKNRVYHISEYKSDSEQLLLYHHSIGHNYHDEIMRFQDKKVLIYHNITPSHFFKKNEILRELCKLGRIQLEKSSKYFSYSIADSKYNANELLAYNYKKIKVLPVLIDFEKEEKVVTNEKLIKKYSSFYNFLFVGRIVPHKAQLHLIDVVYQLKQKGLKNFVFHIVGSVGDEEYMKTLKSYALGLEVMEFINFSGKVSNEDLSAYYKLADLYLSLSEHEGFGMPLIEAMKQDVLILAYNAGGISTTVPKVCLLDKKSASFVAKSIINLQNNPKDRVNMIKKQKEHLSKFACSKVYKKFEKYIKEICENEF